MLPIFTALTFVTTKKISKIDATTVFNVTNRPLYILTPCCGCRFSLRLPEKPLLSVYMQVGNLFTTPAYCAKQALLCRTVALRTTLYEDHLKNYFHTSCNISSNQIHRYITHLDIIILPPQMLKQTTVEVSKKPPSI
jgi:hypothetical protein